MSLRYCLTHGDQESIQEGKGLGDVIGFPVLGQYFSEGDQFKITLRSKGGG